MGQSASKAPLLACPAGANVLQFASTIPNIASPVDLPIRYREPAEHFKNLFFYVAVRCGVWHQHRRHQHRRWLLRIRSSMKRFERSMIVKVIAARHIAEVVTICGADSCVGAPECVQRADRGFIRRARNVAVTLRRDEHPGDNSQQPKLIPCETI